MKKRGFTLAEILISLSVIGIIAAIVIPSLMYNINSKVWTAKRAAIFARMNLAITSMDKIGGYGAYTINSSYQVTADTGSETFITDGLAKVYKIKRICSPDDYQKCGPKYKMTDGNGKANVDFPTNLSTFGLSSSVKASRPTTFETANGELVLAYYNTDCVAPREDTTWINPVNSMCVNFIYDINGSKAPNKMGEDIGVITVFQGRDSLPEVVMPEPMDPSVYGTTQLKGSFANAIKGCEDKGENYTLPNMWEMASLMLNKSYMINASLLPSAVYNGGTYWTSSVYSAGTAGQAWIYAVDGNGATQALTVGTKGTERPYYCIYKTTE